MLRLRFQIYIVKILNFIGQSFCDKCSTVHTTWKTVTHIWNNSFIIETNVARSLPFKFIAKIIGSFCHSMYILIFFVILKKVLSIRIFTNSLS